MFSTVSLHENRKVIYITVTPEFKGKDSHMILDTKETSTSYAQGFLFPLLYSFQ